MHFTQAPKRRHIDNRERTVTNLDQTTSLKLAQHFADVNRRQPRRVRDVMLAQRA
jgi:hypothetical protein